MKVKAKSLISTGFLRVLHQISQISGYFLAFEGSMPEKDRSDGHFAPRREGEKAGSTQAE
jgi:hypothetical protein